MCPIGDPLENTALFLWLPAAEARIFFMSVFSDALGFVETAQAQNLAQSISAVSQTMTLGHTNFDSQKP